MLSWVVGLMMRPTKLAIDPDNKSRLKLFNERGYLGHTD